jgi:hypothetical protein
MGVLQQAVTAAFLTNWEFQAFYREMCVCAENRHGCKKAYILVV